MISKYKGYIRIDEVLKLSSLRYDKADPIISDQFDFHRVLFKELQNLGILCEKLMCFIEGRWGYIVEDHSCFSPKIFPAIMDSTTREFKDILIKTSRFFKIIEDNDGVASEIIRSLIHPYFRGEEYLSFMSLIDVYQKEKESYVFNGSFSMKNNLGKNKKEVKNAAGNIFVVELTSKSLHRSNFMKIIALLIRCTSVNLGLRSFDGNKADLNTLGKSFNDLFSLIKERKVRFSWRKMERFFETWGEKASYLKESSKCENNISNSSSSEQSSCENSPVTNKKFYK